MTAFQNQVAVVTGGTSGIGRAVAALLADQGAEVIVCGRRSPEVPIPETRFEALDVADASAVDLCIDRISKRHGRIDILVNSAGIASGAASRAADLSVWDQIMAVNLRGTMLMCRAVLPGMTAQGTGAIVNVGSGLGLLARDGMAAYSVSKAAVVQLTKCLAIDCADSGVRVNCVCPGLTETPMTAPLFADGGGNARASVADHALRRAGRSEEIAAAIAYLASSRASFVTGAILAVDGGYAAGKWMGTA